jgi:hypothetical protein
MILTRTSSIAVLGLLCALPAYAQESAAAGDRAWEARAEALDGRLAKPDEIEESIRNYRTACDARANGVQPCWKLLRSLHYLIDFTNASETRKQEAVEQAVSLARTWVEEVEGNAGGADDRAQLYFWSAIVWGARGQRVGLLTIVREGVAGRIHEYAQRAVELDQQIEQGGGYRLLSRLHAGLPRVPFVSGWVDRDLVLPLAEKAYSIDPEHPGNPLVLALALLEREPQRQEEAVRLLEDVARREPRPEFVAEDLAIRDEAREHLATLEGKNSAAESPT